MTYFELCKVSFKKGTKELIKPNTSNLRRSIHNLIDGISGIILWIFLYLFTLFYILFFPITSMIVFWIFSYRQKKQKSKDEILRQKFSNLHR